MLTLSSPSVTPILKPKTGMLLCILLMTLLALSGCATLNKSECLKGDWAAIGYNDAIAGLRSQNELQEHYEACAEYKVRPNNKVYFSGYQRGLTQFCTQESGLQYGSNSSEYYGICPKSLENNFLDGYLNGLDFAIADIRDDISELRHQHHKKKHRLKAANHQTGKKDQSKTLKKLRESLNDLDAQISSRRSDRRRLRHWQTLWAARIN